MVRRARRTVVLGLRLHRRRLLWVCGRHRCPLHVGGPWAVLALCRRAEPVPVVSGELVIASAALVCALAAVAIAVADRVAPLKRIRRRRARAELLMHLAATVAHWGRQVADAEPGTLPFAEWGAEHPMVRLCWTFQLTPTDLAQECRRLARTLERDALDSGYADTWPVLTPFSPTQPTPAPPSPTPSGHWVDTS